MIRIAESTLRRLAAAARGEPRSLDPPEFPAGINRLRAQWRNVVTAEARALGIRPPAWLKRWGARRLEHRAVALYPRRRRYKGPIERPWDWVLQDVEPGDPGAHTPGAAQQGTGVDRPLVLGRRSRARGRFGHPCRWRRRADHGPRADGGPSAEQFAFTALAARGRIPRASASARPTSRSPSAHARSASRVMAGQGDDRHSAPTSGPSGESFVSCGEHLAGIRPRERLGGLVVSSTKASIWVGEVVGLGEDAVACSSAPGEDREEDLDLVEPRGVGGGELTAASAGARPASR